MTTNIPKAFLDPIIASPWKKDDYNLNLFDRQIKENAMYSPDVSVRDESNFPGSFSEKEFKAMVQTGLIPKNLFYATSYGGYGVNEHFLNSLNQFYARVQKEWDSHIERTNKLVGTPAGKPLRAQVAA